MGKIEINLPITVGEIKKAIEGYQDCTVIEQKPYYLNAVCLIKEAIHEVTGLKFEEYTTERKKRMYYYAKVIFTNKLREIEPGYSNELLAELINRDVKSVERYLYRYKIEIKYSPEFREILKKVESILNTNVSQ